MKRLLALAVPLALGGCSEPVVRVETALDGRPIADLPVWLLSYDRLALQDSLVQESDEPEPAIPAGLVLELETLRSGAAPAADDSLAAVRRQRRAELEGRADSIRIARRAWREQVLGSLDSLARQQEEATGFGARVDTTDARGLALLSGSEGRLWVWAVYVVADGALEWSVPVVLRGDTARVRLDRDNARVRRLY
jgi:hypothetical protein